MHSKNPKKKHVSARSTKILLSASIRLRNSDLTLDSLVPAHLSRDQFELALLLKHYQIGLWGQPRRGGAGRKGSEVEPVKRNTSRYYRRRDSQKTDTFVCQLQSEITDHSCVLITNRGALLLLLLLGVGFRVFDGRIIETVMPGRQLVQLSNLRLSS